MMLSPTTQLTRRQRQALQALATWEQSRPYPPTLSDLAEALGMKSRSAAHHLVGELGVRALVTWEPGQVRTLTLTPLGRREAARKDGG